MSSVCYCHFDESYTNEEDYDDYYEEDYDDSQDVFLTNSYYPKKDWFCCNCYNFFETKSECVKHEKVCMKVH